MIFRATHLIVLAWGALAVFGCGPAPAPSAPSSLPAANNPSASDVGATLPTAPTTVPTPSGNSQTPRSILVGDYTIAFVAHNCAERERILLPAEFRTRKYLSHVEQDGTNVSIALKGLPRMFDSGFPMLWGQIERDGSVTLTNYYGNEQWDAIFDQVTPTNLLSILVDTMTITVSPEGLPSEGAFAGYFSIYDWSGTGWRDISSECFSWTHSVTFTPSRR